MADEISTCVAQIKQAREEEARLVSRLRELTGAPTPDEIITDMCYYASDWHMSFENSVGHLLKERGRDKLSPDVYLTLYSFSLEKRCTAEVNHDGTRKYLGLL